MQDYQQIIEQAWEERAGIQPGKAPAKVGEAVEYVLAQLDQGGRDVRRRQHRKAGLLQVRLHQPDDLFIVVNDQNSLSHGLPHTRRVHSSLI